MDDNFELNPNEQLELNITPEALPVADQPEEVIPVSPAPRKRRRKRRKRPAWQRMLWKYWPTIRFGLIIIAGILLIWLALSSIGALFTGPAPTDPTDPTINTEPTDMTTAPTTEPTEPPTTAPTEPPDPFAGAVSQEWYNDTLFIGDFNFAGLRDTARSGNADYFCTSNIGVFNWETETAQDNNFENQTLDSLLATKNYKKIIINMGVNNCGYPTASLIKGYQSLLTSLVMAQSDAQIVIHGLLPVTKNYMGDRDYFSPTHITEVNNRLADLADGEYVFYINVYEAFIDADGYLMTTVTSDGCRLTSSACNDWAKLIGVELGKLGIE